MIKYRVPATTANLGIGFDCLGMALNIYDYFEVEYSDIFNLNGLFVVHFFHLKVVTFSASKQTES